MRLKHLLFTFALTTIFLIAGKVGWGQELIVENFEYEIGSLPVSNWNSANSGNPILIESGSLSFSSYASSAIGNYAKMADGLDYNRTLGSINSGSVYAAILINVTNANAASDYILHFTQAGTTYKGRLYLKASGSGVAFGVAKSGTSPAVNYSGEYLLNQTHLLVLKYTFNSGTTSDDVVELFINPTVGDSEPISTLTAADNTTLDATSLTLLGLRQPSTSNASTLYVDGIRVATSWADAVKEVVADNTAPVPTFDPVDAATGVAITVNPTITFDETIYTAAGVLVDNSNVESLITFTDGTNPVAFTATITDKVITVVPSADLANAIEHTVTIAAVEDAAGNEMTAPASASFTTIAAGAKAINITAPEANEVFTVQTVYVTFTVANFNIPSEGKVKYTLTPSGTGSITSGEVTASPINLTELTEDAYTIELELVDVDGASLVPTVTASIQFSVNLEDVATPTFTPVAGTYYSTQNVEITCATADAEIRYTTNGDEPSESSSLYSTPIEVSATTTIKAKAFKAGMTPSALATAAYTIVTPTDVADIAALRASAADNTTVYKLTSAATITQTDSYNNRKYIQDASGAILIYDPNPAKITGTYNVGDGITNVIGKLYVSNEMLRFTPVADAETTSSNPAIAPGVKALDAITVDDEAKLVKVVNVIFNPATGTFGTGKNYTLEDGAANTLVLRTDFFSADYIGTDIPATSVTLTGVLVDYNGTMQFTPRNLADFQSAVATLTDLKVNDVTVTGFDAATLIYNVELPFGAAVPAVAATATSTSATLDITQATVVDGGVATVLVTAQDGVTTKTYTVNFTEGSPSTDASVTSTIYNVNAVEKSITGIPVTATLAEFKSNLTPATGATFEVYQADGTTVATNLATGYKVVVTAQDGIAKSTYTITLNTVLSSEANILTYSLLGVNATISSTGYTVTLTLPYGTSLDNLVATFTLSPAATAKVNDVVQVSGTTANSYSSALLYVITAEDGTIVNWTVTVTLEAPSSEASVTSTLYTVNSTDATITSVPFGTLLVDFKAAITPAANAVFEVYQPDGTTVATDLNSGYKLIVTAQDGTTKKVYTITIDEAPAVDLFFSEYIEGSSNNKAIEIYNPTGAAVDLSKYSVKLAPNGGAWNATPQALTGTLASGEVFVITNADAGAEIKAQSDLTSTVTYFNGDDALGLFKDDVLIDVIGKQGEDPGTAWSVAGIENATSDRTLVRKSSVTSGNTDWAASAGTNVDNSEWIVYPLNTFTYLGTHSTALSSAAEITAFSFAEQVAAATIDATSGTITIEVLYGTDLTGLVSTFTVSAGAKAYVNDALQVSGTTDNDFTDNVVYKVVAEDGTIKNWTVTVTMPAQPSTAAEIVSFVLAEQTGAATINSTAGTIAIEVNSTADLTALTPTIQVSAGASISPASGAVQDFTNAVTYTVTAQDNTTTKAWTVTVTKPQVNVVTIAQIQQPTGETGDSPYANQIVETTGIVTAIQAGKGFFIQDGEGAWSGILVYTNTATGLPAIGDEVKVKGWVKEYYSYTEITTNATPAVTVETTVLSSGNTLPAATVLTSQAVQAEEYEGVLVKVVSAEVISGPSATYNEYIVNDGSGDLTVDDKLFLATFTVGSRYSITGVMDYSFDAFKLLPRDASDIATGIDDVKWGVNLEVYPNPFTNTINFSNVEDVELITVTNLIGQRVMTVKPESSNSINTDNLIKGIYLVSFQNRDGKVIVKKMIKQ